MTMSDRFVPWIDCSISGLKMAALGEVVGKG